MRIPRARTAAAAANVKSGLTISGLPPEVLGKIFEAIPDEERCDIIPVVCRAWHHIHRTHPPRRSCLLLPEPITPGMLHWCSGGVTAALEAAQLTPYEIDNPGLLYELLTLVARSAPRLRKLDVSDHSGEQHQGRLLGCLALFSRIECLKIHFWEFHTPDAAHLQRLTGLISLKDLELYEVVPGHVSQQQAAGLWGALATLQHLSSLFFSFYEDLDADRGRPRMPFFFEHLPLLKHLRKLSLASLKDTYIGGRTGSSGGVLHEHFSRLSQLTALRLLDSLPIKSLRPVLGLPLLVDIAISVRHIYDDNSGLKWQSRQLTCLRIYGSGFLQVSRLLPATLNALPQLQILGLKNVGLQELPYAMAAELRSLRELDISRNLFDHLPLALAQLTGLERLCMDGNNQLRLEKADLDTLGKLTKLESFDVNKGGEWDGQSRTWRAPTWTEISVSILDAMKTNCPRLRLCYKKLDYRVDDEPDLL